MSLLPASEEFLSEFPSPRHLSLSRSYPFDLSSLGDRKGSNATVGVALRATGTHKPLRHWGGGILLFIQEFQKKVTKQRKVRYKLMLQKDCTTNSFKL